MAAIAWWDRDPFSLDLWLMIGGVVVFTTVGSLIEDRRPGQPVGRICLGIGVLSIVSTVLAFCAIALDSQPGRLPPIGAAMALVAWIGLLTTFLLGIPLLVSRFPDGRDSGRTSTVFDVLLAVVGVILITGALQPGELRMVWIEPADNPFGIAWIPVLGGDAGSAFGLLAYFAALGFACVGLVRRYAGGGPVVRAQIRWFAAAVGFSMLMLIPMILVFGNESVGEVAFFVVIGAWAFSLLLPPIAIGIAILRYHLYEIDRIISRTISWAIVTVVLGVLFVGVILLIQTLLAGFVGNGSIPVAISTLAVFALFQPVLRRVRRAVDRRFDRARYDGERTAAAFRDRLRDEVDMETVTTDLLATARGAIAPTSIGIWLRTGRADR